MLFKISQYLSNIISFFLRNSKSTNHFFFQLKKFLKVKYAYNTYVIKIKLRLYFDSEWKKYSYAFRFQIQLLTVISCSYTFKFRLEFFSFFPTVSRNAFFRGATKFPILLMSFLENKLVPKGYTLNPRVIPLKNPFTA